MGPCSWLAFLNHKRFIKYNQRHSNGVLNSALLALNKHTFEDFSLYTEYKDLERLESQKYRRY